jgi:hypothetical protein
MARFEKLDQFIKDVRAHAKAFRFAKYLLRWILATYPRLNLHVSREPCCRS